MIAAFVIGMETNDTKTAQFDFGVDDSKIMGAVSLKHFVGYSMPNNGRDRSDATIAPWIMERICVPPFRAGMSGGSIMINSGSVNGVRSHENWNMLTDLLRNQLQFTGLAVSDWNDVWKLSGNLVDVGGKLAARFA
jgi:beta-glucosidase